MKQKHTVSYWRAGRLLRGWAESDEGITPDPCEVLGVPRDTPIQDIVKAYRRIMQRVHPDLANVSDWFARAAAAAYRTIRLERGEPT